MAEGTLVPASKGLLISDKLHRFFMFLLLSLNKTPLNTISLPEQNFF